MSRSARALAWFAFAALLAAGFGAAVMRVAARPAAAAAQLVYLPGSQARIATFPEVARLSPVEARPATRLAGLPFGIDDSPKPGATPNIERQTILGAVSYAPRPPRAVVAALQGRADLSDAERDALVEALLDLGQPDQAIAVRRARLAQTPDDPAAHTVLLQLLESQNRLGDWFPANAAYFQLRLRQGRAATDPANRREAVDAAASCLRATSALAAAAAIEAPGLDAAEIELIDAFPENADLLADYASELTAGRQAGRAQAALEPRLARCRENCGRLWEAAAAAFKETGQTDRLVRLLEESLKQAGDNDALLDAYGRVLAGSNLAASRRARLLGSLQAAPDAESLRTLAALEIARQRPELARDELREFARRVSGEADPPALLQLSAFAARADDAGLAAKLALDAVVAGEPAPVEIVVAAAKRLAASGDAAWPTRSGPDGAFDPAFVDRGPGVAGGLLSLGTNRLGARAALNAMPETGGRYANARLAVALATAGVEKAAAAKNFALALDAGGVAADVLRRAGLADPLDRLGRELAAMAGGREANVGRALVWRADAAALRGDFDGETAALRSAIDAARQAKQDEFADQTQARLEQRLLDNGRYAEVLALKWDRVQRYPHDAKAMQDLLDFAESHELFADEARAYRLAIDRFDRRTWTDKFARWLLRQERRAEFDRLATEAARLLGENELATFLQDNLREATPDDAGDAMFEKLYAIALERFPANVAMNLRLLDYYERRGFASGHPIPAFQDKFLDLGLRCLALDPVVPDRVLRRLSQRGMLRGMAAKLEQAQSLQPVEAYLWTRVQQFTANYEAARQGYAALGDRWDGAFVRRAQATLARSLAASFYVRDPALYVESAAAWGALADREPVSSDDRVRQGETLLEGGRPREAAAAWERIVAVRPGEAWRWLDVATLYWDYYLGAPAMDTLVEARQRLHQPDLNAIEMAYLDEADRRWDLAVGELIKAAAHGDRLWEAAEGLQQLIRQKRTTAAAVDAAFQQYATRPGAAGAAGRQFVLWLRNADRVEDAKAAALKLLPQYSDREFADAAYELFAEYGDRRGAKAALQRLVEISGRDAESLRRLALFDEESGARDEADKLVAEIAAGAATDEAKQDAWQFAAEYYWRTDRRDAALVYYRQLAQQAGDRHREVGRWAAYADRCLDAKRPDQALEALAKARRDHPIDPALVGATAKAYAAKGDREGLAALYREALNDLKKSALGAQAKKEREAQLRGDLIEALTSLGRAREALDEHVQIINRTAPDLEPILAAHRFAARWNLTAPLLAYYEREAARANRDYRWQYVTGALLQAQGRDAEAARYYEKAAANEPQKTELLEARARALIDAGDFGAAAATYRKLAARKLTGRDYQLAGADVLYLAGRPQEAQTWLDGALAAPDVDVARVIAAATMAWRWRDAPTARRFAARALELILAQPDKRSADDSFYEAWLVDRLQTVGVAAALAQAQELRARFVQARAAAHPIGRAPIDRSVAQLDRLAMGSVARWLGAQADAAPREAAAAPLEKALRDGVAAAKRKNEAYANAVNAARIAQLPVVAEDLQREQLAHFARAVVAGDQGREPAAALKKLIERRAADEPFAPLAAQVAALSPALPNADDALFDAATLARAAGDAEAEKEMLAHIFAARRRGTQFAEPDAATERYFTLLSDAELDRLTTGECPTPGALAIWLGRHGQTARLIATLERHYRDREPRWLAAKRALAYQADPKFAAAARQAFGELLGLPLRIDKSAGVKPPPASATGKLWSHYAQKYGEWLTALGDPAGAPFLYAGPERQPTAAAPYLQAAAALDRAGRFEPAESFLARAAMLGDDDEIAAAKARHLHAAGRDRQAVDELGKLLAASKSALGNAPRYAELMVEIGRGEDGLARWRDLLTARLAALSRGERNDVANQIIQFARTHIGEKAGAAVGRDLLSSRAFDAGDLREFLSRGLPEASIAWVWGQTLDRLAGDVRQTVGDKRGVAADALEWALAYRDEKLARRALAVLTFYDPPDSNDQARDRQRLRAAAYFDGERQAEALATRLLQDRPDGPFAEAVVAILQQEKMAAAADRVWLAYFEPIRRDDKRMRAWDASFGAHDDARLPEANRRTLAADLRLNNNAAARALTGELREAAGQDAAQLTLLARALVDNGAAGEALPISDQACALSPTVAEFARHRLRAYLAAGRPEEAAAQLAAGWNGGLFDGDAMAGIIDDASKMAAERDAARWDKALAATPSPVGEMARAALAIQRKDGAKAAAELAALTEPLRLPRLTWVLRARARRLIGDARGEQEALAQELRYSAETGDAARRLARLDLAQRPFAGLLRLHFLGLLSSPAALNGPLADAARPAAAWRQMPRADRADFAAAVVEAFATIDRPAAAASCGRAMLADLGDEAPRALRRRVEQLSETADKLRRAQPAGFAPNDSLAQ